MTSKKIYSYIIICFVLLSSFIVLNIHIASADDITDLVITEGVINAVFHFNVTSNTDKTYIRYNIAGTVDYTDSDVDPDDINYCDRETWLGGANTERWMIVQPLTESTTYNYTIRLNTGGGYVDDVSGQFTTLSRFTNSTGWGDEFLDDYLWDDSSGVDLYQSVGVKQGPIDAGIYNDEIGVEQRFYEDGKYHMWFYKRTSPNKWVYANSSDPMDYSESDFQDISFSGFSSMPTAIEFGYSDELNKYIMIGCLSGSDGRLVGTGDTPTSFTAANAKNGMVLTTDCIHKSWSGPFDGGGVIEDKLGANKYRLAILTHISYNTRRPTEAIVFNDTGCIQNWAFGNERILNIHQLIQDEIGVSGAQYYNHMATVRNGIYVSFINVYFSSSTNKPIWVYLGYSRDGYTWSFFDPSTAIIPLGNTYGVFDGGMIVHGWKDIGLVENNPNVTHDWYYYNAYSHGHGVDSSDCNIGRIDFPKDGLTYIKTTGDSGWLRTVNIPRWFAKNFTVNGNFSNTAKLNISILNAETNTPYSGFDVSDFDTITTSNVYHTPTWGSKTIENIPEGEFKILFSLDGTGSGEFYSYTLQGDGEASDIAFQSINDLTNNSITYEPISRFNWTKVSNTAYYHLQVANDSAFTDIWVNLSDINAINYPSNYTETSDSVEFELPTEYRKNKYQDYYMRVRVYTT